MTKYLDDDSQFWAMVDDARDWLVEMMKSTPVDTGAARAEWSAEKFVEECESFPFIPRGDR